MLDLCTFLYLNHFSYLFAYKMLTLSTIKKADCGDCPRHGDAMTVTRTRAQALIYWGPRLSASTSSTWLSHCGIKCQQTSQSTLGKRTPDYGLRITGSLVKPIGRIATTSSSATSPCSWPTRHEHAWSNFCPTRFKVGRT
jgi:hypothetical protein